MTEEQALIMAKSKLSDLKKLQRMTGTGDEALETEFWMLIVSILGERTDESTNTEGHNAKKQTNADKIRDMDDEQLAKFICDCSDCFVDQCPMYAECMDPECFSNTGKVRWLQKESE